MRELTPTTSNSSSSTFIYDSYEVFLNFRGEDTRSGFTGHLYDALCQKGIYTFIDNQLERGDKIGPSLLNVIDKSRIAIVVLSANYASSTFCLEELVKIIECSKEKRQLVLPVFCKVDPSHVRHQKESYQEALDKLEERNGKEKIQKWKLALHEIASLSGWHIKEGDGYEFIEKIVEKVFETINHTTSPIVVEYLVGLKPRVKDVILLLALEDNKEVVILGIHGIGGIGKTTIAYAVHNNIVDKFEGVCFLSDVREKANRNGLIQLQEELLHELTREKEIKVRDVQKGISIIMRRLCRKKVLLILDNVDGKDQLDALAGGVDWFGLVWVVG